MMAVLQATSDKLWRVASLKVYGYNIRSRKFIFFCKQSSRLILNINHNITFLYLHVFNKNCLKIPIHLKLVPEIFWKYSAVRIRKRELNLTCIYFVDEKKFVGNVKYC